MDDFTSNGESTGGTDSAQIIGSYRIVQPLGSGGMSSVYRAVHVETGHEVALKVLTRTLARNSTLLQRFLREARSAESLEHPSIVTIYDRGIDRGRHYLVLEYVSGGDFHEYVHRGGPLSVEAAASVVMDVARALGYAASQGLIHRDIKPSNILRTTTGQIKLIDLGLALQFVTEDERVTREGTTVGTVDYMAPEQARDSRATSIQSDIYSLGCTFYFLLTGVPPYPGGDITEKLTRHAKAPVPDVRDLRQDLPLGVATTILRMMAKRPEERYASYDDLIAALEAALAGKPEPVDSAAYSLTKANKGAKVALSAPAGQEAKDGVAAPKGSDDLAYELVSREDEELDADPSSGDAGLTVRQGADHEHPPVLRRSGFSTDDLDGDSTDPEEPAIEEVAGSGGSASVWIISSAVVTVACLLLGIGLSQFFSVNGPGDAVTASADNDPDINQRPAPIAAPAREFAGSRPKSDGNKASVKTPSLDPPKVMWHEPEDQEAPPDSTVTDLESKARTMQLPEWARTPVPDRIEGPFVVVRRVSESVDPSILPTLGMTLDRNKGGTVELADEGPLFVDDLRLPGDSRLIRARPGYRPIIEIRAPTLQVVRDQPGAFNLDHKNLILDGVDLIVNARDLATQAASPTTSPRQPTLFACNGANLTLKNCSITVLNASSGSPFTLMQVDSSASRPTRIHLDRTLVRGGFTTGIDIHGGTAEVVLHNSAVLGGPGPLVRVTNDDKNSTHRLFLIDSILAGPGPIIERSSPAGPLRPDAFQVRAFGSVFGRFHEAGIASVISSADGPAHAEKSFEWNGNHNLFAGWKGFYACGKEPTVTVADLAAIRSTWSAAEEGSQEVLLPWPLPANLSAVSLQSLAPFLPNHGAILKQIAVTRKGLFEKTVDEYAAPAIPQATGWALNRPARAAAVGRPASRAAVLPSRRNEEGSQRGAQAARAGRIAQPSDGELLFDTRTEPWNGDLGAFLKHTLSASTRRARVRVTGTGSHRFTPVRLPDGILLELVVASADGGQLPSWSPQPESTGSALIELQNGALVLSNLILRSEENAHFDHLIQVQDGHLILAGSQLVSRKTAGNFVGDLIGFRAVTTQPRSRELDQIVFTSTVDRPICRILDSTLITDGTALRSEMGRGLIALDQCALAAGAAAIELNPGKVARARFDVDLCLDHCTLISERSIVRAGAWPGLTPGPDRPWLITTRNCAFIAMSDRHPRETVLFRSDADALARGTTFWQGNDDVIDLDFFIAVGDGDPANNGRARDVQHQWIDFWGSNHVKRISGTGPRGMGRGLRVRLVNKLRPGRIEPVDLILDPDYHPGADRLTVGANLLRPIVNSPYTETGRNPIPPGRGRPREAPPF